MIIGRFMGSKETSSWIKLGAREHLFIRWRQGTPARPARAFTVEIGELHPTADLIADWGFDSFRTFMGPVIVKVAKP